jgi:TRAP-type uncharacterized transport system substrate-binding protein
LRSVLPLHSELVTIVARAEIHQLADLSGKNGIQAALGWTQAQAPRIVDMSTDEIGDALCSAR